MSDNPWDREQAAVNQQASGQTGAGADRPGQEQAPPAPAQQGEQQQQGTAAGYGTQPGTEPVVTAESTWRQESAPGFGASLLPSQPQGGWLPPGQDATYSAGYGSMGGGALSQAHAERLLESIVLRQIEESPPIIRQGFMILEQRTGVHKIQLGKGGQCFLGRRGGRRQC